MVKACNDFDNNFYGYEYNKKSYAPLPKPSLNGGLYTGKPFRPNSGYGNYPVLPDITHMTATNLLSANPPPGANHQFPDGFRPGNNLPEHKKSIPLKKYSDEHAIICYSKD